MSTRTDWGIFSAEGQPVAVGDAHHDWRCSQQKYIEVFDEDYMTGEKVYAGLQPVNCPWQSAAVKLDECKTCKMKFIYP